MMRVNEFSAGTIGNQYLEVGKFLGFFKSGFFKINAVFI